MKRPGSIRHSFSGTTKLSYIFPDDARHLTGAPFGQTLADKLRGRRDGKREEEGGRSLGLQGGGEGAPCCCKGGKRCNEVPARKGKKSFSTAFFLLDLRRISFFGF